jgi:hypothetical protein
VREVVRHYKPDGAVLGNSADPASLPHEYWKHLDADMLESYICTWVSKDRWFDWKDQWHAQGAKLAPMMAAGKQIQALSYVGHTSYGVREDAFFCYATARLAGFVWNAGLPMSEPDAAILYQIRLGPPLGPEQQQGGAYFRLFDRGLVVVNSDKSKPVTVTLPETLPARQLLDLFAAKRDAKPPVLNLVSSQMKVEVPAWSGRVYVYTFRPGDDLTAPGPTLTIATDPPLGQVRFRVDGFDYWTHSGRWTTQYELGPEFGKFSIILDAPGRHTIEIVDIVPSDMKTPAGYGTGERLGQFMDPSQPTRPSAGRKFHFQGWTGQTPSTEPSLSLDVPKTTTVTARFEVAQSAPAR